MSIGAAMITSDKPVLRLPEDISKHVVFVLENHRDAVAFRILRGRDLRALEIEQNDHVEWRDPMPKFQQSHHLKAGPETIQMLDRQSRDIAHGDSRVE